jgi:signal transduction histidine kinase
MNEDGSTKVDKPRTGPLVVSCPQCSNPLPVDVRACPNCGVDLAVLFLLGEKSYLEGHPDPSGASSTPQWLVPRIGEYLVEQGLLTQEQIDFALTRQRESAAQGKHVLLGQTLVQLGYLDRETLDRAITHQIIELHAALQESNRTLERRVAERTAELRHALQRLSEINQIKANLISNISHELRTPLAHIRGYVELLGAKQLGGLTAEQVDAIAVIRKSTNRLNTLIDDLIEFSTGSREGLTLHLQRILLPDLISGVVSHSSDRARKTGVKLVNLVDGMQTEVNVDPERLSWAIHQLVDNAIKFTPDGGSVTIMSAEEEGTVRISIQDTGIGIPEDRLEEILEPFHQLDGSATRRYGGTGLGLALVKLILDAHGAELKIVSQENAGSTFSFTLPTTDDPR